MKMLEKGKEKVDKIVDILRNEAIEPAKEEALRIREQAEVDALRIKKEAEAEATRIIERARAQSEQERKVFHSSLAQAAKQSIETLRQEIEHNLFNKELPALVQRHGGDPKVVASFIDALVKAIEKEGLEGDLLALVPKEVEPRAINALIAKDVLQRLQGQSVKMGEFTAGAQIKVLSNRMTVDISDEALSDLLVRFLREDFRMLFFKEIKAR